MYISRKVWSVAVLLLTLTLSAVLGISLVSAQFGRGNPQGEMSEVWTDSSFREGRMDLYSNGVRDCFILYYGTDGDNATMSCVNRP